MLKKVLAEMMIDIYKMMMIDIVRRGGQWQRNVIHGENELNAAAGGGRETTIRQW